jgi:hypothetical protein
LFDKNIPIGVRAFLTPHDVRTMSELGWPDQLENGALLSTAEQSGFDLLITSDQNIRLSAEPYWTENRFVDFGIQHLANRTNIRGSDPRWRRSRSAGNLPVHRNADPVEVSLRALKAD